MDLQTAIFGTVIGLYSMPIFVLASLAISATTEAFIAWLQTKPRPDGGTRNIGDYPRPEKPAESENAECCEEVIHG